MFTDDLDGRKQDDKETIVDKELEEAFNTWKSKSFALTVPLKVVALRGSLPPSWIKVCDTYFLVFCLTCYSIDYTLFSCLAGSWELSFCILSHLNVYCFLKSSLKS